MSGLVSYSLKLVPVYMRIIIGSQCPKCGEMNQHGDQLKLFYYCLNCRIFYYRRL
jgi:hypothetical protein